MSRLALRQPDLQTMMTLRTPTIRGKRRRRRRRRADVILLRMPKRLPLRRLWSTYRSSRGRTYPGLPRVLGRFLRMTGQTHAIGRVKYHLRCKTKYLEKQVKQIGTKSATFVEVLVALVRQYPSYETDLSIRTEIQNVGMLPNSPKAARIT